MMTKLNAVLISKLLVETKTSNAPKTTTLLTQELLVTETNAQTTLEHAVFQSPQLAPTKMSFVDQATTKQVMQLSHVHPLVV